MKRLCSRLTYANVIASLALFIALAGGTAYATSQFGKETIGSRAIKKESIGPGKLTPAAKAALAGSTGPKGAAGVAGPQGPKGDKGDAGAPATKLWASVTKTQTLSRGSGVTGVTSGGPGTVKVAFNQDVSQCGYAGTIGEPIENEGPAAFISVQPQATASNTLFVRTYNQAGTITTEPFYVAVFC
jgi:hypothetical protein